MGSELDEQIDRYLRESMQAHEASRTLRLRKSGDWQPMELRAKSLREQALALDPERQSQAWQSEIARLGRKDIHEQLMAFYERKAR
jgi:hypothetical protein